MAYPSKSDWTSGAPGSAWWITGAGTSAEKVCSWTGHEIIRRAQTRLRDPFPGVEAAVTGNGVIGSETMGALAAFADHMVTIGAPGWDDRLEGIRSEMAERRVGLSAMEVLAWLVTPQASENITRIAIDIGPYTPPVWSRASAAPVAPQASPTCEALPPSPAVTLSPAATASSAATPGLG